MADEAQDSDTKSQGLNVFIGEAPAPTIADPQRNTTSPNKALRDYSDDLKYFHEERDPRDNRESRPPDGETVRLNSLFVVETWTPSNIASLHAHLERLGWTQPRWHDSSQPLGGWLQRSRATPFGGSYYPLGLITKPSEKRWIGRGFEAELPAGVDHARATLVVVSPSMTSLVVQFIFEDGVALSLNEPLHHDYATEVQPHDHGALFLGVAQQKQAAIAAARSDAYEMCTQWLSEQLPGSFARGVSEFGYPACEVMTFTVAEPAVRPDHKERGWNSYEHLLRIESDWDAWRSSDLKGWTLLESRDHDEPKPFMLLLAGRWDDVTSDKDLKPYGGENPHGLCHEIDDRMNWFMLRFSAGCLLRGLEEQLAGIRDATFSPQSAKPSDALAHIEGLQDRFSGLSHDVRLVAADLLHMSKDKRWFRWNVADFAPVADFRDDDESLVENMRSGQRERAKRLVELESAARSTLLMSTELVAAATNLRVGRRVLALTWALFVLTIVLVVLAVVTIAVTSGG